MKQYKAKPRGLTDGAIEAARRVSRLIGGAEITIGSSETGGIKSYFNDRLPPLEITTLNAKRNVAVEVSSVEQENDKLLHFLFRKTVEG